MVKVDSIVSENISRCICYVRPAINEMINERRSGRREKSDIMLDEVTEAIEILEKTKTPVCEGIDTETLQALAEEAIKALRKILNVMWHCKK